MQLDKKPVKLGKKNKGFTSEALSSYDLAETRAERFRPTSAPKGPLAQGK